MRTEIDLICGSNGKGRAQKVMSFTVKDVCKMFATRTLIHARQKRDVKDASKNPCNDVIRGAIEILKDDGGQLGPGKKGTSLTCP